MISAVREHTVSASNLYQSAHRLAICGHDVLLVCMHDAVALCSAKVVLGQMQIDLIAVKVGVERGTVGIVHADDPLPLQMSSTAQRS